MTLADSEAVIYGRVTELDASYFLVPPFYSLPQLYSLFHVKPFVSPPPFFHVRILTTRCCFAFHFPSFVFSSRYFLYFMFGEPEREVRGWALGPLTKETMFALSTMLGECGSRRMKPQKKKMCFHSLCIPPELASRWSY
jgi:hypothetical protein